MPAFPVVLELTRSRRLLAFLLAAHGLAILGGILTPWTLSEKSLFLVLAAISLLHALRCLARQPGSLFLAANGTLRLNFPQKDKNLPPADRPPEFHLSVRPVSNALIFPWLCVFSWRAEDSDATGSLVLLADSFRADGANNLRRLNIWLRWKRRSG